MLLIHQRLTQAGIFLALSLPAFFLSTLLGSLVTQPAVLPLAIVTSARGSERTSPQCWLQRGLVHQQRLRQPERYSFSLSRSATALDSRPDIVLANPLRRLERPNRRLAIMQPSKMLRQLPAIDPDLALALDKPHLGRARLSPPDRPRAAPRIHHDGLGLVLVGLHRALEALQLGADLVRQQRRVDVVEAVQDLDQLGVARLADGLVVGRRVLRVRQPRDARGVAGRHRRQRRARPQQLLQPQQVVGEAWERGEVRRRRGDDAVSS